MNTSTELKTEKLEIIFDNRDENINSKLVKYPLYEANFATGLKFIFRRMLASKGMISNDSKQPNWMEQNDDSNMLAFIGGRGAGKTTAMGEFCRILESISGTGAGDNKNSWMNNVLESDDDINKLKNCTVRFHVLKMIDAGLLNDSEDLLELILVSLYQEYTEKLEANRAYSKGYQSLMMEIDKIFEELLAMYSSTRRKNLYNEDYTLATLTRLTGNSALMREKISSLLSKICSIQKEEGCVYEYYVIPIDDLDLNLKHGYEMLEQLQKYFSDEKILILLTMDYEQLCDVCMEHFHNAMEYTDNFVEVNSIRRSQRLATDMMTKVFPLDQRIFLPDAKKQGKQMRVVVAHEPQQTIPVKKYIMERVAEYMRIYYDAKGNKHHFIEPDTVRQLVFYDEFLKSLYHIDFGRMKTWIQIVRMQEGAEKEQCMSFNKKQMMEYEHNHHRFNDDIAKRQAQVMLSISHRQAFKTFLGFDVSRRAMYLEKAEDTGEKIVFTDVPLEERNRYAYSDLIQKMYIWGRTHYDSKPFISCVLSSFTSEMVKEYVNYRYNPDAEKRELSKERLTRFMGRTFGNVWIGNTLSREKKSAENKLADYFYSKDSSEEITLDESMKNWVPTSNISLSNLNEERERGRIGFQEKAALKDSFIYFNLESIKKAIDDAKDKEYSRSGLTYKLRSCIQKWLEEEKIIQILECLDMFLIQVDTSEQVAHKYDSGDICCEEGCPPDFRDTGNGIEYGLKVHFSGDCILDILGFIPKTLDVFERKDLVEQKICDSLADFLSDYMKSSSLAANENTIKKILSDMMLKVSIFAKVESEPVRNEVAFPFYDLDMAYNVIKRYRGKIAEYKSDDLYKYLLHIYDILQKLLKEEAEEYDRSDFHYDEIFQKCAYMEGLRSFQSDTKAQEKISVFLKDAVDWTMDFYGPESPEN